MAKGNRSKTETEIRAALEAVGETAIKFECMLPSGEVLFQDKTGQLQTVAGRTFVNMCEGFRLFSNNTLD